MLLLVIQNFFSNFLWTIFITSGGLLVALYILQNRIVYVPYVPIDARTNFFEPKEYGFHETYEEVFVRTPDGETIQCWLFKTKVGANDSPTLLFFHGNAGNISHRLPNIKQMVEELTCNVFIVSYRGYGKSTGVPSEIGLKLDSMSALHYLQKRGDIDPRKIILFGRSLGGAVAADLAAHTPLSQQSPPLAGLILENTFTSIYDMQQIMFPALSLFRFLCTNRWMTTQALKKVRVPILFISGGADEVVPAWMMKKLYEVCEYKKVWEHFPDGEHMDTWTKQGYWRSVKMFINDLFAKK